MRLILLVALTMTAFAANSVLNRAALETTSMDASRFAVIRLLSGAAVLAVIVLVRDRSLPILRPPTIAGAVALYVYMIGFSLAYQGLDAGTGALILFGGVQITMFAGALLIGEAIPRARWLGAGLAFLGLVWLVAPGGIAAPDPAAVGLMSAAAVGWGVFSLLGRRAGAALPVMAASFFWAAVLAVAVDQGAPWARDPAPPDLRALLLAVVSGAVTSGLGYALWYAILPALGASRAAVAQLSVPAIAAAGGIVLLGEVPVPAFLPASALILGGVALSLRR
jgi:drug/metabolite transporter (DMT)-like permease